MHPIYTTILSGKGQTIHVMIIPEVARLISAELARARSAPEQIKAAEALLQFDLMEQQRQQTGGAAGAGGSGGAGGAGSGSSPVGTLLGVSMGGGGADGNDDEPPIGLTVPGDRHTLCGVSGWLVINSMRSERLQFELLCEQSMRNVWRKRAFAALVKRYEYHHIIPFIHLHYHIYTYVHRVIRVCAPYIHPNTPLNTL